MKPVLYCGGDLRRLGVVDEEGGWDMEKLGEHIMECPMCGGLVLVLARACLTELDRLFRERRAGGASKTS